jgi:hypothetical protein
MLKKVFSFVFIFLFFLSACDRTSGTQIPTENLPGETSVPVSSGEDWGNYNDYKLGLISSEHAAVDSMPNASIYHIAIQIADDLLSLQGQEKVRYTNQETQALSEVYFQLFPNMEGGSSTITAARVDGSAVEPVYEDGNADVRVPLSAPLEPGQTVVIELEFSVTLPQDAGGNYGLFGYLDNVLVLDGFYPASPVYDSTGWHKGLIPPNSDTTFQDVSFYQVTVTAPKNLVIAASGIATAKQEQDGKQVVTFAIGPARDFYIAASDEFEVISKKVGETTINSYTVTGLKDGSKLALETAATAIKAYNERIGTYPYTEFDVVSTPMQGAYGIEYPGIVGINYALYDLDATIYGTSAKTILESTVAHESGHQWFYNVVGDDQYNEPWLDESMTQYITALYYLEQYGQEGFDYYQTTWYNRWSRVDQEMMPIGLSAASYSGAEYGGIVYGRGPLFVDALAQTMGNSTFHQFLKDYYQANKWGIATTASYKQLAEKECGCDLSKLFSEWVY